MQIVNYIMLAYFLAVFALINWKGNVFLQWPAPKRILVALAVFTPWAAWIVVSHIVN